MKTNRVISIGAMVNAPIEKVWNFWTQPGHVMQWNHASSDWYTPQAVNDLRPGGRFSYTMSACDGSVSFDFSGTFILVDMYKRIDYQIDDGRMVQVLFDEDTDGVRITENFEAEDVHPDELQRAGWQSILDNFALYTGNSARPTLRFQTEIKAPSEKVYQILTDDQGYRKWTSVFNPSSHFVGSWDQGSLILFLGHDEHGKRHGMVSKILENLPGRLIRIEHIRTHSDDIVNEPDYHLDTWSGALESYFLTAQESGTIFRVEVETLPDYLEYFLSTWPEALKKLKEICENGSPTI